ncbi:MAG TPA: aminomethyl-transferring glycine dehydrogenase subunit GcvPA [Candidatus Limnocylindria bacterium]|nr:aminomethyl-transferring glycine dehydrogenase subunit GcvPA [Candidatus Limnocylindria bacterium]
MRYTPHTEADKQRMLREIGCASVEDLYRHVPQSLRDQAAIGLPPGLTELEVRRRMTALAARNNSAADWSFFLGGGIYHHFIPSAVDATISRAEFSTSYTPYQPEVSQGTLQALFEYQTLICQLTGMEVANAAVYDGASAVAEAVLMSRRIQPSKKRRVLMSRALHPQYRAVVSTYLKNLDDVILEEVPFDAGRGATDFAQLQQLLDERTMCVLLGYPNFFGVIEDPAPIRAACDSAGAHLVTVTSEPLSLALLKPPGAFGADIAVGEGQSLGVPMSLGGPAFGFFACQKKFVRNIPGRLVGETVDSDGRRGFVLTLATREQHIRREKATSNICTSQTLCALAATVYMALLGKSGLRRIAEINLARAHDLQARLSQQAGLEPLFPGPFFNEFVLQSDNLPKLFEDCAAQKIVPGIALEQWYPELKNAFLVCATEMNEREEIDRLVRTSAG